MTDKTLDSPRTDENIWRRAGADLRTFTESWWMFRIPATALSAGFAAIGVLLPHDTTSTAKVGLAVLGVVGGPLLLGALAFLVFLVDAPRRQRDEARARLSPSSDLPTEAARFYKEFAAFVSRYEPLAMPLATPEASQDPARMKERKQLEETAVGEYVSTLRARALALLDRTDRYVHPGLRNRADAPTSFFSDLTSLEPVFRRIAEPSRARPARLKLAVLLRDGTRMVTNSS